MSLWVSAAGILAGLGVFLIVRELIPARASLDAALARLGPGAAHSFRDDETGGTGFRRLARHLGAAAPWLPVPDTDLALLGQDREAWLASKIASGLLGLAAVPLFAAILALDGVRMSLTIPAAASLALGIGLFFAPDLVTRINAAERRTDFRHAITSYLDLVALERGAGAGPTEALEAAADIGGGWAFQRISAGLDQARRSGATPWSALATLGGDIGVNELMDLADIAAVAGQEGARILETLSARAASMRAEALASDQAKAGARSTTMVIPIALLGAGFLLLLIFPILYRTFGPG